MFGKLLNSVTWQIRSDLRRKLKANRDHKNLSWNLAERLQVYCSTHYIHADTLGSGSWRGGGGSLCPPCL